MLKAEGIHFFRQRINDPVFPYSMSLIQLPFSPQIIFRVGWRKYLNNKIRGFMKWSRFPPLFSPIFFMRPTMHINVRLNNCLFFIPERYIRRCDKSKTGSIKFLDTICNLSDNL